MTNELEKQSLVSSDKRARISGADDSSSLLEIRFFDTFGIEPIRKHNSFTNPPIVVFEDYPQITDRILLELIFIITTLLDTTVFEDVFVTVAKNREELKKDIFEECITYKEHIKHQVQALFKEG